MDNLTPQNNTPGNAIPDWNTLKHTLLSIVIGAAVSAITVLFQEAVSWLHHFNPESPGIVAGIVHHIWAWKTNRVA